MAWFDAGEAMGTLNAIGRDANNFIKRAIEEIEKDFSRFEVNTSVPRFGQSRNQCGSRGTSEGGSTMESDTRGLTKKAMACQGCSAKFSVWRRKRECMACKRMYCSQCLPKMLGSGANSGGWCTRERRQTTCSRCMVLLAQPPSRSAIHGLRTRDLQAFLASQGVPTHGCLEKDDLVSLVIQLSCNEVNGDSHASTSDQQTQSHSVNPPPTAQSERRLPGDIQTRDERVETSFSRHSVRSGNGGVSSSDVQIEDSSFPPTLDGIYPQIPTEDLMQSVDEVVLNHDVSPSVSLSEQASQSGLLIIMEPPSRPSSLEDGDWEIIEPEDVALISANSLSSNNDATVKHLLQSSGSSSVSLPRNDVENIHPSPSSVADTHVPMLSVQAEINSAAPTASAPRPTFEDSVSSSPPSVSVTNVIMTSESSNAEPEASLINSQENPLSSFHNVLSSNSDEPSLTKAPRDVASSILSSTSSIDDLASLSVRQLKKLLTSSRVDYRGCCEKKELLERAQRLWREHRAATTSGNLSDDSLCKVCMDAAIDCVMLECGHVATCTPCGKRMSECPICRQYVVRIVRTFKA